MSAVLPDPTGPPIPTRSTGRADIAVVTIKKSSQCRLRAVKPCTLGFMQTACYRQVWEGSSYFVVVYLLRPGDRFWNSTRQIEQ